MQIGRLHRLSRRLLSQLEDFYVHESHQRGSPAGQKWWERHLKVVKSQKTKEKLERWFRERKIPIRFIYGDKKYVGGFGKGYYPTISPIGKPGVITFYYSPEQDPPTAWMIVHNLSHAIYDIYSYHEKSPHEISDKERFLLKQQTHPSGWIQKHNIVSPGYTGLPGEGFKPTTRSYILGKIENSREAFHELFAQWVSKGKVILSPRNPEVEKELEKNFRERIDYMAKKGAVVYNI